MNIKLKKTISYFLFGISVLGATAMSTRASAGLLSDVLTQNSLGFNIGVPIVSVGMEFNGYVTMLGVDGTVVRNLSFMDEPNFHGWRTPIKGKMVLNFGSGGLVGAASFDSFLFLNVPSSGHDVQFRSPTALLNLLPTNTLLLGNMLFDYGEFIPNIPVSIVLDIGQLTTALKNTFKGQVLNGVLTAASDGAVVEDSPGSGKYGIPLGPVLVGTTAFNTTDVDTDGDGVPGPIKFGTNPSGTAPLVEDATVNTTNGDVGIGGSPIRISLFKNFNPNFDIVSAKVTCVSAVLSCSYTGLKIPNSPELSAAPLAPLLKLLP